MIIEERSGIARASYGYTSTQVSCGQRTLLDDREGDESADIDWNAEVDLVEIGRIVPWQSVIEGVVSTAKVEFIADDRA